MTHYDMQYEAQQCEEREYKSKDVTRESEDYRLICGDKKIELINNVCSSCKQKFNR